MKIGACYSPRLALMEYPSPADYIEVSGMYVYAMEKETFQAVKQGVDAGVIQTYSCNGLIIPELRLTGPDVDFVAIREYCKRLFDRLAQLRVSMLVFGSGKAKHVPEGFPMEKAWEQLLELGTILSDEAGQYGQTVAVEPLSYDEVNIVNTVEDASYYARSVNRDNFKILVDFYHFNNNGESDVSLAKNQDLLVHTHISTAKTRAMPMTETEWMFFADCIKKLKAIGYDGGMSFEGKAVEGMTHGAMIARMKEIERNL